MMVTQKCGRCGEMVEAVEVRSVVDLPLANIRAGEPVPAVWLAGTVSECEASSTAHTDARVVLPAGYHLGEGAVSEGGHTVEVVAD